MNDLISRYAAIEVVGAIWAFTGDVNVAKAWDQINALPSAQPERIKGKWVIIKPLGEMEPKGYMCSNCRTGDWDIDIERYKFCPYCGADMRGEDDE